MNEIYCVDCGAEIPESMGAILARDFLAFNKGERRDIRGLCGIDNLRMESYVAQGGDKGEYLERILANPAAPRM